MSTTGAITWLIIAYGLMCTGNPCQASGVGTGKIISIIDIGNITTICPYIECQLPLSKEECPEGSFYMEGVAQFGCCGACVIFKQNGDVNCTGSISGGYSDSSNRDSPQQPQRDEMTNLLYSQWCDYGLQCDDSNICVRNEDEAPCRRMQEMYDAAISGNYTLYRDDYRWRPQCTPEGNFTEKQCKGPQGESRCVCVDPVGNTIFGKAFPGQKELFDNMNCKCSRKVWERQQAGEKSVTLHCQENGNYEPLQCDGGYCYCMDPVTAIPHEPVFPEAAKKHLSCFNESLVGTQYMRRCESEYHAHVLLNEAMKEHGTEGPDTWLKCDADGSYSGEQFNDENYMIYCYDKYKEIRDPYGPANGGCNCVRDHWLFVDNNVNLQSRCAPSSGKYEEKQEVVNKAFCVDADGIRSGPMVFAEYADLLNCTNAQLCQAGDEGSSCEGVCMKNETSVCDPEYYIKYSLNS